MHTDLTVADHPTTDPSTWVDPYDAEERDAYLDLLHEPVGYRLVRTLDLTKYFTTDPITGKPFSVARRQYLGEAYEYRTVLRMDKVCTSILPVPNGLPGDIERCLNPVTYRAVRYQGYPVDGTWRACTLCASEGDDEGTEYVSTLDGQPRVPLHWN